MICYRCMRVSSQETCEHCGFNIRHYETPQFALRPGTILKKTYLLGTVIGNGGFGITYIGYDNAGKRRVAIKEFFPASAVMRDNRTGSQVSVNGSMRENYQRGVQKFYNEASVMSQIRGIDNIVPIYDFFYENNTAYIVMKYIDGTPVDKIIKNQGPLSVEMVLTIYYPILEALRELHNRALLHRDISPSNIMLDETFRPVLIDFGASRVYSEALSSDMTVILKQGFAPLEQYTRKGHHGPAEDIYALSASMYYTLTGQIPPMSTDRIRFDTLRPISDFVDSVPGGIENVIMKGLAVRSEDRFQSADDMIRAIDAALLLEKHDGWQDESHRTNREDSDDEGGKEGTFGFIRNFQSVPGLLMTGIFAVIVLLVIFLILLLSQ